MLLNNFSNVYQSKMTTEISADLLNSLQSVVERNIKEYNIDVKYNEKAVGFLGQILCVILSHKITGLKTSLVVKQELEFVGNASNSLGPLFSNEIKFYEKVWPFLEKYYYEVGKKELNFIPECLRTVNKRRKQILLTNLKQKGYELYPKMKPFDDDHCRKVFNIYGLYHGISMALRIKDNERYIQLVGEQRNFFLEVFEKEGAISKMYMDKIREVKEYFDPMEEKHILNKLNLYDESGREIIYDCLKGDFPNGVILHGDCWSNNMLFKYDEYGRLQYLKLLDFQIYYHGSPVFDLSYCLYSAADAKILEKLDDYLKVYHSSLSETLGEFGLEAGKIYPFQTMKDEWKYHCKLALPLSLGVWKEKLGYKDWTLGFTKDNIKLAEDFKAEYKQRARELIYHMYNNDFL